MRWNWQKDGWCLRNNAASKRTISGFNAALFKVDLTTAYPVTRVLG